MKTLHEIHIDASPHPDVLEYTICDAEVSVHVVAEQGSKATVSLVFDPSADTCHASLEIVLAADAHLTVLCLQTSQKSLTFRQNSTVADGAHLHVQNVTLGSRTDQSLTSHLEGVRAVSDIDWIFYACDKDAHTLSAQNVFSGSHGSGQITMKGVAEDTARVQCDGMINIEEGGSGTDTYLTEDVLMLDPSAKVNAVPGLEIKTNDVSASHSATVSKVTPEDLFYFASRGIDASRARGMYVRGFLGDLTARIAHSDLRGRVLDAIDTKFTA